MIVVAGETITDLIEFEPQRFEAFNGGAPYNVARALAKLGANAGYISPISNDMFGDLFSQEMSDLGIHSLMDRTDAPTGIAIVKNNSDGIPSYQFYRDHAADRDINIDKIKNALASVDKTELFYIGGLALTEGKDAEIWAEALSNIQAPIFVDPNIRPSFIRDRDEYLSRLLRVYQAASLVKLSDEDIQWLDPQMQPEEYMKKILGEHGIETGLLTLGERGAKIFNDQGVIQVDAPKIQVVDTVGAGDCFSASFMVSYLRGDAPEFSLRYAVTAAAINCSRAGANPPNDAEIQNSLNK